MGTAACSAPMGTAGQTVVKPERPMGGRVRKTGQLQHEDSRGSDVRKEPKSAKDETTTSARAKRGMRRQAEGNEETAQRTKRARLGARPKAHPGLGKENGRQAREKPGDAQRKSEKMSKGDVGKGNDNNVSISTNAGAGKVAPRRHANRNGRSASQQ
jgi:hypothetical protein